MLSFFAAARYRAAGMRFTFATCSGIRLSDIGGGTPGGMWMSELRWPGRFMWMLEIVLWYASVALPARPSDDRAMAAMVCVWPCGARRGARTFDLCVERVLIGIQ